ncbi:MAG TPA: integration host factor subunit alpha [Alcanivoracaceae bacterium]|nr:integration host factor subunit alpha [Alcanivoracaceae bacterium]
MTTLTKAALVDRLHETLGVNKREAKELVEMFFEEVTVALSSNVPIKLSGFGNFDLRDKSERPGRNPKTGEEVAVSARRVVTFKPGQKLRQQVDKYASADSE